MEHFKVLRARNHIKFSVEPVGLTGVPYEWIAPLVEQLEGCDSWARWGPDLLVWGGSVLDLWNKGSAIWGWGQMAGWRMSTGSRWTHINCLINSSSVMEGREACREEDLINWKWGSEKGICGLAVRDKKAHLRLIPTPQLLCWSVALKQKGG